MLTIGKRKKTTNRSSAGRSSQKWGWATEALRARLMAHHRLERVFTSASGSVGNARALPTFTRPSPCPLPDGKGDKQRQPCRRLLIVLRASFLVHERCQRPRPKPIVVKPAVGAVSRI